MQSSCTLGQCIMIKNITLSAPEELIEEARKKAIQEGTSLNSRFREWLSQYLGGQKRVEDYKKLMERLSYVQAPEKKPTRDEMNER